MRGQHGRALHRLGRERAFFEADIERRETQGSVGNRLGSSTHSLAIELQGHAGRVGVDVDRPRRGLAFGRLPVLDDAHGGVVLERRAASVRCVDRAEPDASIPPGRRLCESCQIDGAEGAGDVRKRSGFAHVIMQRPDKRSGDKLGRVADLRLLRQALAHLGLEVHVGVMRLIGVLAPLVLAAMTML